MKILWVVNTVFPDFADFLGRPKPVVGGWMYGLAKDLVNCNTEITVVTVDKANQLAQAEINNIQYYLLPSKKNNNYYNKNLESHWKAIIPNIKPEVVHIHGTEYAHGLSLVKTHPQLNYLFSIQGLISVYHRYYYGQIPFWDILKAYTFRDIYKKDGIIQSKREFEKRGNLVEKKYFKEIKQVIGRTDWDLAHTKALSPTSDYHFCNESLRDSFYTARKWTHINSKKEVIFLSQAGYPIKGLHQVIKALPFLTKEFPNVVVRIAGRNILPGKGLKNKLKTSGYGKYIDTLLTKTKTKDHVKFLGPLTEQEMVQEYLNCNVFICPSSIENSPNSLGEAQLLGTPCIAAYVGGVPNMVLHDQTGIVYRFEEVEQLAHAIKKVFKNPRFAEKLGKMGMEQALKRHDRSINLQNLMEIYKRVANR